MIILNSVLLEFGHYVTLLEVLREIPENKLIFSNADCGLFLNCFRDRVPMLLLTLSEFERIN